MCNYQIGDKFIIHSYKHDKSIHRAWDEAILLDIKDDYLVFGNNKQMLNSYQGLQNFTQTQMPMPINNSYANSQFIKSMN